jgi:predicted esterase
VAVIGHGAGGSGRDLCEFWDPLLPKDFILVCPSGALLNRGEPDGGAYFPDHFAFRAELVAILQSLEESFPGKLRPGFRFMGYSQGATMGALAVVGEISVFQEMVLMEGGAEHWTHTRAQSFGKSGGRRVILACGTRGCSRHAERAKAAFVGGAVELHVLSAPSAGHTYGGAVAQQVLQVMATWEEPPQP